MEKKESDQNTEDQGRPTANSKSNLSRMGRLISSVFVAAVFVLAALPAFANEPKLYYEFRSPSFNLVVPPGWTAEKMRDDDKTGITGVVLSSDDDIGSQHMTLYAYKGRGLAADVVAMLESKSKENAKNFDELEKGECLFGGQKGAYVRLSKTLPDGRKEKTRVVVTTGDDGTAVSEMNGQSVYVMYETTIWSGALEPKQDIAMFLARGWLGFRIIEDSFRPSPFTKEFDEELRIFIEKRIKMNPDYYMFLLEK